VTHVSSTLVVLSFLLASPAAADCVVTIEGQTASGTRTYDAQGRLLAAEWTLRGDFDDDGEQLSERFDYDAAGHVIAAHSRSFLPARENPHERREERRKAYDVDLRSDPATALTRDRAGVLLGKALDHVRYAYAYGYDAAGSLTSISVHFCEGSSCTFSYDMQTTFDAAGRLTRILDRGTTLSWVQGPSGHTSFEVRSPTQESRIEYTYSSNKALESESVGGETVRRYHYAGCDKLRIADFPWVQPESYLWPSGPYECLASPMGALFTCRSIIK
jgi:hypothetical protein